MVVVLCELIEITFIFDALISQRGIKLYLRRLQANKFCRSKASSQLTSATLSVKPMFITERTLLWAPIIGI